MSIVNIAGYSFTSLDALQTLRPEVKALCRELGLKGTVILSPEGVNGSLAGPALAIETAMVELPKVIGIETIPFKKSYSDSTPFDRMLVKVKPRLLPILDQPFDAQLSKRTQLPPEVLKTWLDASQDVVLLDTRNDYEFDLGTFDGAERCDISTFRTFQDTIAARSEEWKGKTVVAFCTGGIRCEKAVPAMLNQLGFDNVYQLEGGILQYFESVGADHWHGDCFVFDNRVALSPMLQPRPRPFCKHCGKPVLDAPNACTYCHSPAAVALPVTVKRQRSPCLALKG